jgi:hypothetical protein
MKRRKQTGYVHAAAFVNAYLGLDDYDQAFAWLDQAYKEQWHPPGEFWQSRGLTAACP